MGLFNLFFGSSEPTTKEEIAEAIAKEEEKLASCESQYIFMKDQYQKHGGSSYGMMRTEQEMAVIVQKLQDCRRNY